jgi:hypothetical protein
VSGSDLNVVAGLCLPDCQSGGEAKVRALLYGASWFKSLAETLRTGEGVGAHPVWEHRSMSVFKKLTHALENLLLGFITRGEDRADWPHVEPGPTSTRRPGRPERGGPETSTPTPASQSFQRRGLP